jgi:pimeloyl-ACP methyl ester carboxylesterase
MKELELEGLLRTQRFRWATDPRDRVFAFLGVAHRRVIPQGATRGALLLFGVVCCVLLSASDFLPWYSLKGSPVLPSSSPFGLASSKLEWVSCGDRFECANLSVPLDYLNSDDKRTASIAVTRYLSSKPNLATGTIIFNPGGPGGSGTGSTFRLGPLLDGILQGQYDILGFDPRGINMTVPKVACLKSVPARTALQQILGSTAPSIDLHDVGIWDSFAQLIAEECEANSGANILPFVNTPTVARDIASIVDALHAEKKHHVSYWGFSYGTNLGAIFTAMFPNKLHKIILDGIRSPFDAREIFEWGYTSLASQNDIFEGYFEICEKVGKARCPLAGLEKGARETVMDLLASLYQRPLPVSGPGAIGLVTFYDYKSFLYGRLYSPRNWLKFANITMDLLRGNGSSFLTATDPGPSGFGSEESGTAVLCTDAVPATNYSLSLWSEFVHNMTQLSFIAGDSRSLDTLPCRHWYSTPNERWTGSFDTVQLDVPVLMIGNTYDPATPLDSAKRLLVKMGAGNAVLLEQRSYGHCSVSSVSTCTHNVVLDYLLHGVLPEVGKVCDTDGADYGDYFPSIGEVSTSQLRKALGEVSAELSCWSLMHSQ